MVTDYPFLDISMRLQDIHMMVEVYSSTFPDVELVNNLIQGMCVCGEKAPTLLIKTFVGRKFRERKKRIEG